MSEKLKRERTESILVELIPEALSSLNDTRLHGLSVIKVVCAKGRDNCKVYLDPSFIYDDEKGLLLGQLRKAGRSIEGYCATEQGWFRSPKLTFNFDKSLQHELKMSKLFSQVEKELKS